MRLFRRGCHHNGRRPQHPEPDQESGRALAESRRRLQRDREQVIQPLRRMADKNNVTELAQRLTGKRGPVNGHGATAG